MAVREPGVGTLYVVGAPAGDPADLTLRAIRILREVDLVAAEDMGQARRLLDCHDIATPLVSVAACDQAADTGPVLRALERGDAALLTPGWSPGPLEAGSRLILAAIGLGFPIAPVPGPVLPVTALVISGLPADSFVYLGELPQEPAARCQLLASMAGEGRTLIIRELPQRLVETLAVLGDTVGDRPLVVVEASERGTEAIWRGTIGEVDGLLLDRPAHGPLALILGGAREQAARWDEDRLAGEIRATLERGLGAREISHQLAAESGWPRREIYRRAVQMARFRPGA